VSSQFKKPSLTLNQQLALLKNRGLIIDKPERVIHYLRFIGYYRLSGYFRTFQILNDPNHIFKNGTTFDSVLNVYIFDRRLRLLVMDAVERVEVAMRSTISNTMCEKYGPHWYMEPRLFHDTSKHNKLITAIEDGTGYMNPKKQNDFCKHYYTKYNDPHLPPSWMVAEVLPIGVWSSAYDNLKYRDDQKKISNFYGLHYIIMISWLHSFTYLRNLCAHHSRLWNRKFTIKPKIAKQYEKYLQPNDSFYANAAVLNVFLYVIADGSRWTYRLYDLLNNNNHIPIHEMGFPTKWSDDSFWRIH